MMDYRDLMHEMRALKAKYPAASYNKWDIFHRYYPSRNFITNNFVEFFWLNGHHIVELSWGRFIDHYIYGVTVVTRNREGQWVKNPDLTRCFQEGEESALDWHLMTIHKGVD